MTDDIKTLISLATGYTVTDDDAALVDILYKAEVRHVLNFCNLSEMPQELAEEVDKVVAGKFLQARKAAVLGDASVSVATSIKEGDTEVQLGGNTPEERLDSLIAVWTEERDLTCFRRLRW